MKKILMRNISAGGIVLLLLSVWFTSCTGNGAKNDKLRLKNGKMEEFIPSYHNSILTLE